MAEYIARGAARKILQDLGDAELLQFSEAAFQEQEDYILRRTYRQTTNQPTSTIYNSSPTILGWGRR
jgi:hypothetical protein